MAVLSRAVDYWTDDAFQQCSSVLVRWYDVLKYQKMDSKTQVFVAVKTHVAASASTNSQGLTAKSVREELSAVCACTGPVGTGLGAVRVR